MFWKKFLNKLEFIGQRKHECNLVLNFFWKKFKFLVFFLPFVFKKIVSCICIVLSEKELSCRLIHSTILFKKIIIKTNNFIVLNIRNFRRKTYIWFFFNSLVIIIYFLYILYSLYYNCILNIYYLSDLQWTLLS